MSRYILVKCIALLKWDGERECNNIDEFCWGQILREGGGEFSGGEGAGGDSEGDGGGGVRDERGGFLAVDAVVWVRRRGEEAGVDTWQEGQVYAECDRGEQEIDEGKGEF